MVEFQPAWLRCVCQRIVVHLATGVLVAFGKYGEESLVPAQLPAEFVCVKCVHLNVGVSGVCVCWLQCCSLFVRRSAEVRVTTYSDERSAEVCVPGCRGAEGHGERAGRADACVSGTVQVQDRGVAEEDAIMAGY